MKKIIYILMLLPIVTNAAPLKVQHKKDVANWHNIYLKGKIGQEATHLISEKIYYLIEFFNQIFKDKKIDKAKLTPIANALNDLSAQIKKIDKGPIAKALEQLQKKIKSFKVNKNDPQETIKDLFNYLLAVYSQFYNLLKDKKIIIGPDKGKNLILPKDIEIPNNNEIKNYLNNQQPKKKIILKAKK